MILLRLLEKLVTMHELSSFRESSLATHITRGVRGFPWGASETVPHLKAWVGTC